MEQVMDSTAPRSQGSVPTSAAVTRTELGLLLVLVVLALVLRIWMITHTEVAARDSIGFIRIAWRFQHEEWREVVRTIPQHPLYPASVAILARGVIPFFPDDLP